MQFQQEALRASCGCALRIFRAQMLNNILVIDIGGSKQCQLRRLIRASD